MEKIILPLNELHSPAELQAYLKEVLELPDYYGENLDALYDVLTERSEPLEFIVSEDIQEEEYLGDYGTQLLCLLQDVAAVNAAFQLTIE